MEHEEATPDTPRCSPRYRFLIPVFIVVGILVFTTVVMLLWNAIIPDLTGWSQLTWPKALGLLVLCKILFGGFKGKGGHGGAWRRWGGPKGGPGSGEHMGWKEKWHNMTDEQRQRMRDEWRKRCGGDRFRGRSRRWIEVFTEPARLEHHANVQAFQPLLLEARARRRSGRCGGVPVPLPAGRAGGRAPRGFVPAARVRLRTRLRLRAPRVQHP